MNPLNGELPYQCLKVNLLNSELLPTLRCYHCNKLLSKYYEQLYRELDFNEFVKSKQLDRYCCRLVLLQDHLAFKDALEVPQNKMSSQQEIEPSSQSVKPSSLKETQASEEASETI